MWMWQQVRSVWQDRLLILTLADTLPGFDSPSTCLFSVNTGIAPRFAVTAEVEQAYSAGTLDKVTQTRLVAFLRSVGQRANGNTRKPVLLERVGALLGARRTMLAWARPVLTGSGGRRA
jgi:hypothetical protein